MAVVMQRSATPGNFSVVLLVARYLLAISSNPRLCGSLGHRSQKMVLATSSSIKNVKFYSDLVFMI